ncbi:MAG TPA: type II toxin-antitoxin system VapB family antitoxin [Xanthobacteraceae bacterium]|nr:type II toxin-antitoxin system VapB family antitoxin [Xanthobacteraceae bacterium]
MERQLNIRSDEAYEIVSDLARRTGHSRTDVVLAALYAYAERKGVRTLTPPQRAFADELLALARRSAALAPSGMTSDHSYLYDENGLPK